MKRWVLDTPVEQKVSKPSWVICLGNQPDVDKELPVLKSVSMGSGWRSGSLGFSVGQWVTGRKVRNCRNRDMMFRNVWNFLLNSDTSTLPHQNITHPISTNTHLSARIGGLENDPYGDSQRQKKDPYSDLTVKSDILALTFRCSLSMGTTLEKRRGRKFFWITSAKSQKCHRLRHLKEKSYLQ